MSKGAKFGTSTAISVTQARSVLKGLFASNGNAALRYLQVFDKATAPVTSDVPVYSFPIPIAGSVQVSGLFTEKGVNLFNGIALGISTAMDTYQAATATDHVVDWNVG